MSIVLRPLSDRVVITPDERQKYVGSIIVPGSASYKPQTGTVKWVGPGYVSEFPVIRSGHPGRSGPHPKDVIEFPRMPMVLEPGMRVLFGKYSGTEITIEDESYFILRLTEVLCVIEEEDNVRETEDTDPD
jgi:chaperonin GroES